MLRWFENRLDPYPSDAPVEPPRSLLAFCLHYMDGAKRWLVYMAVSAALIAILEVMLFGFMGNIVDWLTSSGRESFFANEGGKLALMAAVVLLVLPTISLLNTLVIHQTLLGNFPQRIRWMVHTYLIRQSMNFFQDEFAGRIAAKLMQTSLAVREVAMKLLDMLVYVLVYFTGAMFLAASSQWRLAIPFIVWLVAYTVLLRHYVPRLGKVAQLQADARSMMTGRIVDAYTNIATVKLFSHAAREERYARDAMDEFLDSVYRQMRIASVLNIAIDFMNAALLVAVAWLGILFWQQSLISAGAVAVTVALVLRLRGMSYWIMWEMSALFENIGTVRDGINTISTPRQVGDHPQASDIGPVKGAIVFNDVNFFYPRGVAKNTKTTKTKNPETATLASGLPPVIDHLTLSIKPGEKIGLIGRSGAGKSTLVNLLLRFYDLDEGKITIDGTDISTVTQNSLRANIGMVTQDTSLLHRSVRDNITYGRPDASEQEIIKAAKLAQAHDFIVDLRDSKGNTGYDAQVGERGVKLSGGQRQRIAISRVLLKDAPVLVLDEATSALDSEVEAAIQGQFELLMKNKTVIAIAHRLSTIAAMDRLVVLDRGKIIEQGTHAELIEKNGHYAITPACGPTSPADFLIWMHKRSPDKIVRQAGWQPFCRRRFLSCKFTALSPSCADNICKSLHRKNSVMTIATSKRYCLVIAICPAGRAASHLPLAGDDCR